MTVVFRGMIQVGIALIAWALKSAAADAARRKGGSS